MDRNLLHISNPVFLCWPSKSFQRSVSKPSLSVWISLNFFIIDPSKWRFGFISQAFIFFQARAPWWGPDWLPPFCFPSLFPAPYLKEAAGLQDLGAWLLSAGPAVFFLAPVGTTLALMVCACTPLPCASISLPFMHLPEHSVLASALIFIFRAVPFPSFS